jgi:hypothetical protein
MKETKPHKWSQAVYYVLASIVVLVLILFVAEMFFPSTSPELIPKMDRLSARIMTRLQDTPGDALAPRRSASGGSPADKLTNTFLNLIDGEIPLNRVFTVLTTNRLDILDPALIRSKRLKVMEISGHLQKKDIAEPGSCCRLPPA